MPYRVGRGIAGACPRCQETLLAIEGNGEARWCEKCGGVFANVEASTRILATLDRTLLEIGFQAGLGKARKAHDARVLTCPECLIEMKQNRIEAAACTVDACPLHGTWFDTGELEDVLRAFAAARKRGINLARETPPPRSGPAPDSWRPPMRWADDGVASLIHFLDTL